MTRGTQKNDRQRARYRDEGNDPNFFIFLFSVSMFLLAFAFLDVRYSPFPSLLVVVVVVNRDGGSATRSASLISLFWGMGK